MQKQTSHLGFSLQGAGGICAAFAKLKNTALKKVILNPMDLLWCNMLLTAPMEARVVQYISNIGKSELKYPIFTILTNKNE